MSEDGKEAVYFVSVIHEEDPQRSAGDLIAHAAFVYLSPKQIFRLWIQAVGYAIKCKFSIRTAKRRPNEREVESSSRLRKFLMKLFRWVPYETMSGAGLCPVYLERWTLLDAFGYGIYLHHFLGDDWALDPHDHPRRFVSIGLWGWYDEDVFSSDGALKETLRFHAPWFRSFPAEHLHRVRAKECGNTWTLVIVFRKSRAWGFVRDGIWLPFRDYVFGGNSRKSC